MDVKNLDAAKRVDAAKPAKTNLFESERMFLDVHTLAPGQEQKPHVHDGADKIYVVTEGRGTFRVADETKDVAAGNAVLAPAGVEHGVKNTGSVPLVLLIFMAPHPNYVRT